MAKLSHSHIIPEFFYTPLYDDKHKIHVLSTEPKERRLKIEIGIREYLLCEKCEGQFSKYETYASGVFYHNSLTATQEPSVVRISGINYTTFKLFMMSLLWRMGVSNREFFRGVQLFEHEELLRKALMANDSRKPIEYAFSIFAVFHEGKFQSDLTFQPSPIPKQSLVFRVVIAGFLFVFYTAPRQAVIDIQETLIRPDGDLWIFRKELSTIAYLQDAMERLAVAERERKRE